MRSRAVRLTNPQLVDRAYRDAGIELFDKGIPSGVVNPADLAELISKSETKAPVCADCAELAGGCYKNCGR